MNNNKYIPEQNLKKMWLMNKDWNRENLFIKCKKK